MQLTLLPTPTPTPPCAQESIYGIGPTPMQPEYCYPVDPDMGVRNCDAGYSTWLAVAIPLCSRCVCAMRGNAK